MPESRGEWAILCVGVALVVGLVFVAVRARHHAQAGAADTRQPVAQTITKPATTAPTQTASTATTTEPQTTDSKVRTARGVALTVRATGASSWVEVRTASATGPVLYSGTLSAGARESFHAGGRLWARFGGAGNVAVVLNGRPVRLPTGTYDAFFDSKGFKLATRG